MAMSAEQLIAKAAECETCGKEHQARKDPQRPHLAPQWSAPDGHPYRPSIPGRILGKLRDLTDA